MIKIEDGKVRIQGDIVTIMSEFTVIVKSYKEMLSEKYGEEISDLIISECGKLAYRTEEELKDDEKRKMWQMEMCDKITPLVEDKVKKALDELKEGLE